MVNFFNWSRSKKQIEIIRYAPPKFTGGIYVFDPIDKFRIWASVQPLGKTDQDLIKDQPRLNRYSESLVVYANEPLLADDDKLKIRGDTVIIGVERFRVFAVQNWQHLTLRHYRHLVVREN